MIDVDLWNLLMNGDIKALETLYIRHYDLLLNYGLKCYSDKELVKDAIQDLFVKLHNSNRLGRTEHVRAYLLRSLRNILFDKLADNKETEFLSAFTFQIETEDEGLNKIFKESDEELLISMQLIEAFNQLSENQKNILYLRYVKGLSHSEISDVLSITPQSSMNLINRTLTKLRSKMLPQLFFLIFF